MIVTFFFILIIIIYIVVVFPLIIHYTSKDKTNSGNGYVLNGGDNSSNKNSNETSNNASNNNLNKINEITSSIENNQIITTEELKKLRNEIEAVKQELRDVKVENEIIENAEEDETLSISDDFLLHITLDKETILRALNNILLYNNQTTYISLNQISTEVAFDSGIDKQSLEDNVDFQWTDITNTKMQYIQGFTELKENGSYLSHKLSSSIPTDNPVKITGSNHSIGYIVPYKRLIDDKKFYFIQLTQKYVGVKEARAYKAISELIQFIIINYPGDYIIIGNFNVHGHEKIFKHYLTEEKYHIFDTYKYVTCNNDRALFSPDGIVISKNLYQQVHFFIDFYPGNNWSHYLLGAKLYINAPEIITNVIISDSFKRLIVEMEVTHGVRKDYINDEGDFDSSISDYNGSISNVQLTPLINVGVQVYHNTLMTDKLIKI